MDLHKSEKYFYTACLLLFYNLLHNLEILPVGHKNSLHLAYVCYWQMTHQLIYH